MLSQRTIRKAATMTGIGLHSGKKTSVTLRPSTADAGIIFKRIDLQDAPEIPVTLSNLKCSHMATTIGEGENAISTVEHLLSALASFGIDNCICEVEGPEVPVMDGSAAAFVFLIKDAGVRNLTSVKKVIVIQKDIEYVENDKKAVIRPSREFSIKCIIEFNHPVIGRQELDFTDMTAYLRDVGRARTFGFLKDVEKLRSMGLAQGGSLDNAIVLDDEKVMNESGLRFPDEFVRHKILDAIGDLSLFGMPVIGRFEGEKSGHAIHSKLISTVLADPTSHTIYDPSMKICMEQISEAGIVLPAFADE